MTSSLRDFLDLLSSSNWGIALKQPPHLTLNLSMQARYPNIPGDYLEFLRHVSSCVNADETAWFLCEDNYNDTDNSAFVWNEWELLSSDGLTENSDDAQSVTRFWDAHLPFMLSVKTGYSYLAFNKIGQIVYGFEPGFEEPSEICASFRELTTLMKTSIANKQKIFGIRDFLDLPGEEQK